jgi:hypothetical protein
MSAAFVHLLLIVVGAANCLPVDQWTSDSAVVEVTTKIDGGITSSSSSSLLGVTDQLLADDLFISSQSRQKPADDGGIEFPNTAFIPGDLTEQLSVDGFFSLWFVFLDDDVFTSGECQSPFLLLLLLLLLLNSPFSYIFGV